MNPLAQHYTVWRCFNNKVFKKTLTNDNVSFNGTEKYVESVFRLLPGQRGTYVIEENKPINTKCVFLEKGNKKYILPTTYQKYLPLNVKESFECYLKTSDKTVYVVIQEPKSVKITPTKTLSLKELCDVWNPMQHTDPKTWTFLKLQAIGSKAKGCKYRLCGPAELGKNSNDIIIHNITNSCIKIPKPTLAKLETLFYYSQKVIPDEMTCLPKSKLKEVEPFFLALADETPTFHKHSLAQIKDLNEVDITRSSCIFTYNDRASLQDGAKFFDEIWDNISAFNTRYPALLLSGRVIGEMPKLSIPQANVLMEDNFDGLSVIAKNIMYYIENMSKELHGYNRDKWAMKTIRHRANFEGVIDAIDVYSDSQEEFDEYLEWVNEKCKDYYVMARNLGNRLIPKEEIEQEELL